MEISICSLNLKRDSFQTIHVCFDRSWVLHNANRFLIFLFIPKFWISENTKHLSVHNEMFKLDKAVACFVFEFSYFFIPFCHLMLLQKDGVLGRAWDWRALRAEPFHKKTVAVIHHNCLIYALDIYLMPTESCYIFTYNWKATYFFSKIRQFNIKKTPQERTETI